MKEEKKKEKTAMLYELQDRVKGRINFIEKSGLPEEETKLMLKENEIFLRIITKVIDNKIKPIESIETARGSQYKIGSTFCINGNDKTKYEIQYFPDGVTVRGTSKNPEIGQAWTVEAYIEDIFKPKKQKEEKPVKEKKLKPVEIKVGEYFALRTNNTIYKATRVKKEKVFGIHKLHLKDKDTPKLVSIGALRTDIILKTKKEYKKQMKAEKNY